MFVAAAYTLIGDRDPNTLLYVQAFVGATVVPLMFFLVRRVVGERGAPLATVLVMFDGP